MNIFLGIVESRKRLNILYKKDVNVCPTKIKILRRAISVWFEEFIHFPKS